MNDLDNKFHLKVIGCNIVLLDQYTDKIEITRAHEQYIIKSDYGVKHYDKGLIDDKDAGVWVDGEKLEFAELFTNNLETKNLYLGRVNNDDTERTT